MDFNLILKFLAKKGGYPNKKVESLKQVFGLSDYGFLTSMVQHFGKTGAEEFIQEALRKSPIMTVDAGPYVAEGYETESFIELDLSDVKVEIEDVEFEHWAAVLLENIKVIDSNIVVETDEGELIRGDIFSFLNHIRDLDPTDYDDTVDSFESTIDRGLSKIIGPRILSSIDNLSR